MKNECPACKKVGELLKMCQITDENLNLISNILGALTFTAHQSDPMDDDHIANDDLAKAIDEKELEHWLIRCNWRDFTASEMITKIKSFMKPLHAFRSVDAEGCCPDCDGKNISEDGGGAYRCNDCNNSFAWLSNRPPAPLALDVDELAKKITGCDPEAEGDSELYKWYLDVKETITEHYKPCQKCEELEKENNLLKSLSPIITLNAKNKELQSEIEKLRKNYRDARDRVGELCSERNELKTKLDNLNEKGGSPTS